MNLIQTTLQKEQIDWPNQLEFLQVIDRRGLTIFSEEKKLCKSLQAGVIGERKLLQYLVTFGSSHWVVLKNLWLKDFKKFECDLLLITKHCIYIFEVKNYQGKFSYKDGKCFFNEVESPLNPLEQVRANAISIRNYLKRHGINLPVKAAVVFTGQDNEVHIHSEIDDIEVVPSSHLRNFIQRLVVEENQSPFHNWSPERLIEVFEKIEILNPFLPEPLAREQMREIKGGIYCANCLSFEVTKTKAAITCACGLKESLEEAVIRTVCDYSILQYGRSLSRQELSAFFDGQVSVSYLRNVLTRHFDTERISRNTVYHIPPHNYEENRKNYSINQPRIFYHKNGDIHILQNIQ